MVDALRTKVDGNDAFICEECDDVYDSEVRANQCCEIDAAGEFPCHDCGTPHPTTDEAKECCE